MDQIVTPPEVDAIAAGRPLRWWALGFVLAGYLSVFAGVTVMNIALPAAQADIDLSDLARRWVVTVYALSFGASMLLGGRLADRIGLRRSFIAGMVGFAAASLFGGLATSGTQLLTARALQGAAGAVVAASGLALLSVMFAEGAERARAFAVLGTVMGLGTAGSFVLGGLLVDTLSWRWCLLINLPIAVVVATGLRRTAPHAHAAEKIPVDLPGAALVTASMALLVVGFDRASALGWARPVTWSLLVAGLVLAGLFAGVTRHRNDPLLPPELITDRLRAGAFTAVGFVGVAMFAGMYFLTTYLQDVLGYRALITGLAFVPFGVSATVTSWLVSTRGRRFAPGPTLAVGLVLTAAALATFAVLDPTNGYGGVLAVMALLGSGGTVVMVTGASVATSGAGPHTGTASAMVNASQQVGAALGTALLIGVAAAATDRHRMGGDTLEAVLHGYAVAGAAGAAILACAAAAVMGLVRNRAGEHGSVLAASPRPAGNGSGDRRRT